MSRVQDTLTIANIPLAYAALADVAFCGVLTTTVASAIGVTSVMRGKDKTTKAQMHAMAAAYDAEVERLRISGKLKLHLDQMLFIFKPDFDDCAAGGWVADDVARHMRGKVLETAIDDVHKETDALEAYQTVLTAMLAPMMVVPAGVAPEVWANQLALLRQGQAQGEKQDETLEELGALRAQVSDLTRALLAMSEESGRFRDLRDEGITEKAIIRLAQRIAGETEDVGQAWVELQNAMDIAVRVQAEGRVGSNLGDFVDEVLRRVAELTREGENVAALARIEEALAEQDAGTVRLLESGVEVALLERDTAKAAGLLVRKADVDAGGVAAFGELRELQDVYYVRGRDKGVNLDLELAIDLAHLVLGRAGDDHERGVGANDLGVALQALGERESSTARLQAAVTAYENALTEWTREKVPLYWAMTQMNLGAALKTLGERESGTARLEAAVTAYENALTEWTREKVPLQWATVQMNLGTALTTLGERESGTARLEAAVTAYENALPERTRETVPLQWATVQMNLGNALQRLGERESGTARLEAAVTAYENALTEWTREKVPLYWAMTQMNLGAALKTLGERESGTARLEAAVTAYENALKEWTREKVPLQWATTQMNLGNALKRLGERESGTARLEAAVNAYEDGPAEEAAFVVIGYHVASIPVGHGATTMTMP